VYRKTDVSIIKYNLTKYCSKRGGVEQIGFCIEYIKKSLWKKQAIQY
jgi:hypothetical protein